MGFEPTVPCGTPDFESGTFGHSATSPVWAGRHCSSGSVRLSQIGSAWVRFKLSARVLLVFYCSGVLPPLSPTLAPPGERELTATLGLVLEGMKYTGAGALKRLI